MRSYENGRELFRQALIDARLRKSKQILDANPEEVQFSASHLRKMQQILSYSRHQSWIRHPKLGRKRMVAVLIAAALLLIGSMTVYANRDAIVRFMEQVFGKYTRVSYQCVDPDAKIPEWIEDEYTLSYVPEGYELSEYESDTSGVWMQWKNSNDDYIYFTQSSIDRYYAQYDNENSYDEQIQVNNSTVYCTYHTAPLFIYLWTDGSYCLELKCHSYISADEVARMIESVSIQSQ